MSGGHGHDGGSAHGAAHGHGGGHGAGHDAHGASGSHESHGPAEIPAAPDERVISPARGDFEQPWPGKGLLWPLVWTGVAGVLALLWWRTRSWTLALSKAGLERRTSAWRVRIPWSAVERLRRDSNGLLGSSWTIEHEQRTIEGPDGGEPTTKALEDAALRKAGSRLLLDAWTRDPRSAPLGTYLRQHRPDLL